MMPTEQKGESKPKNSVFNVTQALDGKRRETPLERNPARSGRTVLLCTRTYDHTGQGETAEVDI